MELISQMSLEQLKAEHTRLKSGNVGKGFDKQYLVQCVALVADEIKVKEKAAKAKADENAKSV